MGSCQSSANLRPPLQLDGDEGAYQSLFIEDTFLAKGKFSKVMLVREKAESSSGQTPLAVKVIEKGSSQAKNNPQKRKRQDSVERECLALKNLGGEHHCLKLHSLYDSPDLLYVVTEYCGGGNMMEYFGNIKAPPKIMDFSRVAYQLLDALNHCHNHGIMHRDIKPANCLFKHSSESASLRLADFGSAAMEAAPFLPRPAKSVSSGSDAETAPIDETLLIDEGKEQQAKHTTLAGSPFYISPEMFQRNYTYSTDVWSVGVTLYVLVSGYPADRLQEAFNILHMSRERDLRNLPGIPDDMPGSYLDMLEELLTHRPTNRKSAAAMMMSNFAQLHKSKSDEKETRQGPQDASCSSMEQVFYDAVGTDDTTIYDEVCSTLNNENDRRSHLSRTRSTFMEDFQEKHKSTLVYQRFERDVAKMVGTTLEKAECDKLIQATSKMLQMDAKGNKMKLRVIPIFELKDTMRSLEFNEVVEKIDELPETSKFEEFAFDLALLRPLGSSNDGESYPLVGGYDRRIKFSRSSSLTIKPSSNWSGDSSPIRRRTVSGAGNSRSGSLSRNSIVDKWKSLTTKYQEYDEDDEPLNRSLHGYP